MSRGFNWFTPVAVVVALSVGSLQAATFSIVDGEGFESPDYSTTFNGTGQLDGQFASIAGGFGSDQWAKSGGAGSSATVQSAVFADGGQAVRVDKGDGPDAFWGIQQSGYPDPGFPYVCIEWDMLVEFADAPTGGAQTPFGPYFGVAAYDNETTQKRIGYLGVDSQTGDVLYSEAGSGFFTPTGTVVSFDEWHSYQLILDYNSMTYRATVDGSLVLTGAEFDEGFVDGVTSLFTDANISAISADNTDYYMGLTGTAYFDNFNVFETTNAKPVPEPAAALLLVAGAGLVAARRRN
ncbi:hypothetical protein KOR34_20270 [Posidoniimonas corsicana]|uniref:PEP-CTERM protein-sorting domain-containing protein n=1 Tax=Posidoniimonas corsicana TaxID=1938618 RepID=A0A5C5VGJ9_9BACT|nr:PEP-CTERM sorting domain-containing protein [Posidoniimonas corsicana]TWT37080.1 hypothetical protein KOR34_20270 [Posidoniimonas corsicana]